jgi:hypothetical protein
MKKLGLAYKSATSLRHSSPTNTASQSIARASSTLQMGQTSRWGERRREKKREEEERIDGNPN